MYKHSCLIATLSLLSADHVMQYNNGYTWWSNIIHSTWWSPFFLLLVAFSHLLKFSLEAMAGEGRMQWNLLIVYQTATSLHSMKVIRDDQEWYCEYLLWKGQANLNLCFSQNTDRSTQKIWLHDYVVYQLPSHLSIGVVPRPSPSFLSLAGRGPRNEATSLYNKI